MFEADTEYRVAAAVTAERRRWEARAQSVITTVRTAWKDYFGAHDFEELPEEEQDVLTALDRLQALIDGTDEASPEAIPDDASYAGPRYTVNVHRTHFASDQREAPIVTKAFRTAEDAVSYVTGFAVAWGLFPMPAAYSLEDRLNQTGQASLSLYSDAYTSYRVGLVRLAPDLASVEPAV